MDRRAFLRTSLFTFFAAPTLSACTRSATKPKDPLWGKDVCAHCRMTITEPDFAAQIVGPGYSWTFFDDIGCAAESLKNQAAPAGRLYVHLKGEPLWLTADEARFSKGFKTPMNSGIAAIKDGALSWQDVKKALAEPRPAAAHGH